MLIFDSYSPAETFNLAYRLGKALHGGEVIALEGELGAGKTLFVKGLARGLDACEPVTSPTFTLIHLYDGRLPLAHFDVYRLGRPEMIEELGYEEYFYGPGVTAVEWSDLVKPYLPREHLLVELKRQYDPDKGEGRRITMIPYGREIEARLEELNKHDCAGN